MEIPSQPDQREGGERMISEVFYTGDRRWAFQRVGNYWNLYDENGYFHKDFRSFKAMYEYIYEQRRKESV